TGQLGRNARAVPVPAAPDPRAARTAARAPLGRRPGAVRTEGPSVHLPRLAGADARRTPRPRCAVAPGVDGTPAARSCHSTALAARRALWRVRWRPRGRAFAAVARTEQRRPDGRWLQLDVAWRPGLVLRRDRRGGAEPAAAGQP